MVMTRRMLICPNQTINNKCQHLEIGFVWVDCFCIPVDSMAGSKIRKARNKLNLNTPEVKAPGISSTRKGLFFLTPTQTFDEQNTFKPVKQN